MRTIFAVFLTLFSAASFVGAQTPPSAAPAASAQRIEPPQAQDGVGWHDAQAASMGGPAKRPAAPAAAPEPAKTPDAAAAPAPTGLFPPPAPKHERRELSSAAEIALDLAEVVAFLEGGQTYFRAYQKGTHGPEENTRFLRFLEDYERERAIARKEAETLRLWMQEKSDLEANP